LIGIKRSGLLVGASVAAIVGGALSSSAAFASTASAKSEGDALFTTQGGVSSQFLAGASTIPHWTFQYTDPTNGVTYPITMVGNDPKTGLASTVHTVIIPLKLNFVAAGQDTSALNDIGYAGFRATPLTHSFDGNSKVAQTLASPIFSDYTYPSDLGGDRGQLGDTFMRSQFNQIGASYHVKLVNDQVLPTQVIDVPAQSGIAYVRPVPAWRVANGLQAVPDLTGVAEVNWFSVRLNNLMNTLGVSAQTLPIFLTDNVLLYQRTYDNCCILGYHGSGSEMPNSHGTGSINGQGSQAVQTYAYSAYVTPGTYSRFLTDYTGKRKAPEPTRGLSDIHALSHEISEWLDDPFTNNAVQPWLTPTAPQYGCTTLLEVGDPVVGVWFGLNGNTDVNAYGQWHPEDEVFAQWFGRGGVEAAGYHSYTNRLTFMGARTTSINAAYASFGTYAKGC
jgi:hypothetical protein